VPTTLECIASNALHAPTLRLNPSFLLLLHLHTFHRNSRLPANCKRFVVRRTRCSRRLAARQFRSHEIVKAAHRWATHCSSSSKSGRTHRITLGLGGSSGSLVRFCTLTFSNHLSFVCLSPFPFCNEHCVLCLLHFSLQRFLSEPNSLSVTPCLCLSKGDLCQPDIL
jgi:hypothetical protein